MNDDQQARERVAVERRLRGLSARDASIKGGVSNSTWSDWESGRRPLSPRLRSAVAQAFGWSTDWVENPPPAPDVVGTVAAAEVMARLDAIDEKINRLVGLPAAVEELVLSIHSMLKSDLEEEQLQGADRPVEQRRTGSSS